MSSTADYWLNDPTLWREFMKRLSGGTDPEHDFEMIQSFAEALGTTPACVWMKLKPIISASRSDTDFMAASTAKPKPKPKPTSTLSKRAKQSDKLWDAINTFVRKNGGWVVSPPGTVELRIEAPAHSPLPGKLSELGYRPLHIGQATRLTNKPGAKSPWVVMDVIAISLRGDR